MQRAYFKVSAVKDVQPTLRFRDLDLGETFRIVNSYHSSTTIRLVVNPTTAATNNPIRRCLNLTGEQAFCMHTVDPDIIVERVEVDAETVVL